MELADATNSQARIAEDALAAAERPQLVVDARLMPSFTNDQPISVSVQNLGPGVAVGVGLSAHVLAGNPPAHRY